MAATIALRTARNGTSAVRRTLMFAASTGLVGIMALACLELCYRFQIADMYGAELRTYNSPQDLSASGKDTILALGDSFTAGTTTYISYLRNELSRFRVINAGISGTGVVQAALVAPRRFARFSPSVLIYQVYVGNDLFDLRYPVNWHTISPLRNLYWMTANHLLILNYLNYRLVQLSYARRTVQQAVAAATDPNAPFSVDRYAKRQLINLRAEPDLISDQILASGGRARDYMDYLPRLRELVSACRAGPCNAYVVVVPHCAQVSARSMENFRRLCAVFPDPAAVQRTDYPFLSGIRRELAGMSNVEVINPLPTFREAEARGAELYYRNDDHLNAQGHALLAHIVAASINLKQRATRRASSGAKHRGK